MTERLTSVSCTILRGWVLLNLIYVEAGEITIVSKMYAKHQPRSQANAKGVIPRPGPDSRKQTWMTICQATVSRRSKRFRGVGEQGTEFSVFCPREMGEMDLLPLSFLALAPYFQAGKKSKIPFLGLSLLSQDKQLLEPCRLNEDLVNHLSSSWCNSKTRKEETGKVTLQNSVRNSSIMTSSG